MNKDEISGTVLSIQRCAMHDGPGIRTSVFFKGCPLSCRWCHNPESQSFVPQLAFQREKCTNCGICVETCSCGVHDLSQGQHQLDRERCTACGQCAARCPSGALKRYGERLTAKQVMNTVHKDIAYYAASGGGVTLSGGEPLAQPDFAMALLENAKSAGIHTCIETCGHVPFAVLEQAIPLVDCFLYDYKLTSPQQHKAAAGADNQLILHNLEQLYRHGKNIILRCPIIPGINDTEEHFLGIARMEALYPNLMGIEIMPYHDMGKGKAEAIGRSYTVEEKTITEELKQHWKIQMTACKCSAEVIASF